MPSTYIPRYSRPEKQSQVTFQYTPLDYRILELLDEYGVLTAHMLMVLLPSVTYRALSDRLVALFRFREVERLKGMNACVYSRKKGKQLPHRLARAQLHLVVEKFVQAHPEYHYEWQDEFGKRGDPVIADAMFSFRVPGGEFLYKVEIDQSSENVLKILDKMRAHLTVFAEMQRLKGTPQYKPFRVLFATNNIANRLNRVLRRMTDMEESKAAPTVIYYTAQHLYGVEHPDSLFYLPIWRTAHSDTPVALLGGR